MKMKIMKTLAVLILAGFMTIAGCKKDAGGSGSGDSKGTVKLAYVNWAEGVAVTHLLDAMLTDMGYTVETTMADVAPIFAAVAGGDQDVMVETWVPVTHKTYWDKYGDQFEELAVWFDKARIGLVVPQYVNIDSIEDLNSIKDDLEGQITGIDAGAGIMKTTDKALEEYSLDYELVTSSGPAMTAALKSAIDKKEPVVVTGWAPHWKFARYNLKFLKDPKQVYGSVEEIKSICRKGFKQDMPEVAAIFAKMKFNGQQIGSLMDAVSQAEGSEEEAVRAWMEDNKELIDSWK